MSEQLPRPYDQHRLFGLTADVEAARAILAADPLTEMLVPPSDDPATSLDTGDAFAAFILVWRVADGMPALPPGLHIARQRPGDVAVGTA